jgi:hypothetical protein
VGRGTVHHRHLPPPFTWGHARQLDAVGGELLARAWKAGAGPGDAPFTFDIDSTICETYGPQKQGGSKFTYTKTRGYHPLIAVGAANPTGAGTGDILHSRLRGGPANSGRGAKSFVTETICRLRAAGATGQLILRADSGFYSTAVVDACRQADVRYCEGARNWQDHRPSKLALKTAINWH